MLRSQRRLRIFAALALLLVMLGASGTREAHAAETQDSAVSLNEDTPTTLELNASAADGAALTALIMTSPKHGTLSDNAGTRITYTPALDYNGSDFFTFKVNDGSADSNISRVSLIITPVNDAPFAKSDAFSTNEDNSVAVSLSARDVEGSALTYSIGSQPTRGTLTGSGTSFIYTPALNYYGSDFFTFKANDGSLDSNIAKISLAISSANDAPVAKSQSVQLRTNSSVYVAFVASDVDNANLNYNIVSDPAYGTLSGNGNVRLYTPTRGYIGDDIFTFQANDGNSFNGNSNIATVYITVKPNMAPIADNQFISSQEDTPIKITLNAKDGDDNTLLYTVLTQPGKGILVGSGINYIYTPNPDSNGSDSFTFKASDGNLDSNVAKISLAIQAINDAPVAQNQSVTTPLNRSLYIALRATDVDNGGLSYTLLTAPTHGTLTGSGASYKYTPVASAMSDVYGIWGQSNASGRAATLQSYYSATGVSATMLRNNNVWAPLADPVDGDAGQVDKVSRDDDNQGSVWPLVASAMTRDTGIPISFVPCAKGSTAIEQWLPTANRFDRSTLYGSAVYRCRLAGGVKAILWWQGETNAIYGTTQASYFASLSTLAAAVQSDLGAKLIVCKLQNCSGVSSASQAAINAAIEQAWAAGTVLRGPDLSDITSDDGFHLQNQEKINEAAQRWWTAMQAPLYTSWTGYLDSLTFQANDGNDANGTSNIATAYINITP